MSVRGPRCGKHPSHVLVGVCAFCLRERLAGLADVECASDATHTHNSRKKKQSPGHPLSAHGAHKQPVEKRGSDRRPSNVSVEPIVIKGLQNETSPRASTMHPVESIVIKGLQNETSSRASTMHPQGVSSKSLDKSVVMETMVHDAMKKSNKFSVSRASPKASITKALEPISASAHCSKPYESRGSDTSSSIHPPTISEVAHDGCASVETPATRHSFSVTKRPSSTHVESSKLPPPDIKMPILENYQHAISDSKSNMHSHKHTAAMCRSPLVHIAEKTKVVSLVNQAHQAALSDSERKSFHAAQGARRSLPFPETTVENVKGEEITLSDASPILKHKKKTLSTLFSLDDADFPSSKAKVAVPKSSSNAKEDTVFNGSASAPAQHNLRAKTMQRRCKHGSFSERVEPSTYLFPVPEAANSKPLSWFSSLFRRRKKKTHPRSGDALASYSEHNNGWEDARQSWEAPRPSSWEQFRLSSFEGPRSSWEPARPSWEGVMRTSDGDSVFSSLDYHPESVVDVREDVQLTQRNQQGLTSVDPKSGFSDARRSLDSKRLGLKLKPLAPKTPHVDDKDRAHSFLPAKATLMQRDVSTQTTPPRLSDATEIFIQQRRQQSHNDRRQHYAKASHAVWTKVWTKTFSNSKWAFKQKHHKERRPKDMGDTAMPVDEARGQGNMTSGRSSFHEGTNIASNHHPKITCIDNIEEHEAWDTFYSPLQHGRDVMTRLASKGETCIQRDEQVDNTRGSNFSIENGLLKFYLTPVRGHGKSIQGIHGL